ncbi:MAG: zinc-ribbon domain-containing protein [Clostridia bacterium]|nr:zinc-ribbon domain-containing protein [Clostridia bacterium]
MRLSLSEYCLRFGKEDLLKEWHTEKNGDITPDSVSYGTSKKNVWWKCELGHEWESSPYSRAVQSHRCPYCSGKKIAPETSFKAMYPHIAVQWHPNQNGLFEPDQVPPHSSKYAWWQCEKGHEWRAIIKSRVEGNGCPVCSNKKIIPGVNDLETCDPFLSRQWHPEKNGSLKPSEVSSGSKRKVWWRCDHGHEWQAYIYSRANGKGCPVCAGKVTIPGSNDLESAFPEIAKQWNWEKNAPLTPSSVTPYSNKHVWWRCDLGHEWKTMISRRTSSNSNCPYCTGHKVLAGFNDLKTLEPLVAAEWHPTLNEGLEPSMVMAGSSKRVWWKCSEGHEWKAVIYSRTSPAHCGCPVCANKSVKKNRRYKTK